MQEQESLNLDYHRKMLLVKAFNKVVSKSGKKLLHPKVAFATGLSTKTVGRDKERYGIYFDKQTNQYKCNGSV